VGRDPGEHAARAVRQVQDVARLAWLWLPPLLLAGAIFYASSRAIPEIIAPGPGVDKVAHFGVFALLGALCARAFLGMRVRLAWLWGALAAALYGVSDEIHQSFVPSRSAEVLDAVADAAGALAGAAAWSWAAARWRR
jgi:VanZ family protein